MSVISAVECKLESNLCFFKAGIDTFLLELVVATRFGIFACEAYMQDVARRVSGTVRRVGLEMRVEKRLTPYAVSAHWNNRHLV